MIYTLFQTNVLKPLLHVYDATDFLPDKKPTFPSSLVLSIYSDEKTALALQKVKENYKNNTKYPFSGYFFYEREIKLL